MPLPTIRQAAPADARRLAELRFEFRSPRSANTESPEAFIARCADWMRARLATGTWHCWVAEVGGTIIGHVWLNLIEKIPNPVAEAEWHGYITNMYVQEKARGGTGGALMDAVLAWCEKQDIDYLILWPTPRSRALYGRKGFAVAADILAQSRRPPRDTHMPQGDGDPG